MVAPEDLVGIWVNPVFAVPGIVDGDGRDVCPVAPVAAVDIVLVLA